MFHIQQIKAYHGKQADILSFCYQTWRNWLINITYWKCASEAIQLHSANDSWADLYINGNVCNFHTVFVQLIRTDSFKFGIKMKRASTCFPWYAFYLHFMKIFWKTWTSEVSSQFFAECMKKSFLWFQVGLHIISIKILKYCTYWIFTWTEKCDKHLNVFTW